MLFALEVVNGIREFLAGVGIEVSCNQNAHSDESDQGAHAFQDVTQKEQTEEEQAQAHK